MRACGIISLCLSLREKSDHAFVHIGFLNLMQNCNLALSVKNTCSDFIWKCKNAAVNLALIDLASSFGDQCKESLKEKRNDIKRNKRRC